MIRVVAYAIEEIHGVMVKRELIHTECDTWEDAIYERDEYNRAAAEMNSPRFMRVAEVLP